MSNAAKRIPRVVREKIELAEQRRQEVVGRLDAWAEEKLPENIMRPLKGKPTASPLMSSRPQRPQLEKN